MFYISSTLSICQNFYYKYLIQTWDLFYFSHVKFMKLRRNQSIFREVSFSKQTEKKNFCENNWYGSDENENLVYFSIVILLKINIWLFSPLKTMAYSVQPCFLHREPWGVIQNMSRQGDQNNVEQRLFSKQAWY